MKDLMRELKDINSEGSGAIFSEDRIYRYSLWRTWDNSKPFVMLIGLNPSTANELTPDNTIKKVIKVTANNGYGGFVMLNLFGIVSSKPEILLTHPNPEGENEKYIDHYAEWIKDVVFCWGVFKEAKQISKKYEARFPNALCFKRTKNGFPWHPLYCKDSTQFIPFRPQS